MEKQILFIENTRNKAAVPTNEPTEVVIVRDEVETGKDFHILQDYWDAGMPMGTKPNRHWRRAVKVFRKKKKADIINNK